MMLGMVLSMRRMERMERMERRNLPGIVRGMPWREDGIEEGTWWENVGVDVDAGMIV